MRKINKEIRIKKDKIGEIIFKPSDPYIEWLNKKILNILKKLNKFYRIEIPKTNIELIYSRKEFNTKIGSDNTPNWLVGVVSKNKIYIFSPSVIEKYSNHKKSELEKIITHEFCHIFNKKLNKNISILIDEGIALFLSNQKKSRSFKKSDWQFFINNLDKNISFNSFTKYDGFKISYWTIKKFTDKFSKNKLLKLIKINKKQLKKYLDL